MRLPYPYQNEKNHCSADGIELLGYLSGWNGYADSWESP